MDARESLIDERYEILSTLGKGGMGEVFLVQDKKLDNKRLALKLLNNDVSENPTLIKRFKNEADITQEFKHESIVTTHHYGETGSGKYYFTMDYIEGIDLGTLIDDPNWKELLPFEKVLDYLYKIAEAMGYAHKKGIVHRDLKPDNILITKDGEIKITDFGIARDLNDDKHLTRTNEMIGTIYYMAPEQIKNEKADHRIDIYALGILAYQLVTGSCPFEHDNYHTLCFAHLTEDIPKFATKESGIPSWFQDFVEKCCAKDPKARYQTMEEVTKALADNYFSRRYVPYLFAQIKRRWQGVGQKTKNFLIALTVGYIHFFLLCQIPGMKLSGYMGEFIEPKVTDLWFWLRGRITPPDDVVIISIDEESHEKLGASRLEPWPRVRMAELLETLVAYNPKRVVFDYRFPEARDPEIDSRLAQAMKKVPLFISRFRKIDIKTNLEGERIVTKDWADSIPLFNEAAMGAYFAGAPLRFGVVRHFNFHDDGDTTIPPIAEVLYGDKIREHELPNHRDIVNYYGPPGSVRRVSFHEVLNKENPIEKSFFENKYLFVGQQLFLPYHAQQTDTFITPYQKPTAGVEIIATTAGNILERSWIRRASWFWEGVFAIVVGALFSYLILSLRPISAGYLLGATIICWFVASYLLFINRFFVPGVILVLLLLPIVYLFSLVRLYFRIKRLEVGIGVRK